MATEAETIPAAEFPPAEETTAPLVDTEQPVDPLEAPSPPESFSVKVKELVIKRKEEKGPVFACCFATCCCFLCYESCEIVLDFLFCRTFK